MQIDLAHSSPPQRSDQLYRDANGLITICMWCHRTRRNPEETNQWDWVEAYATTAPVRASHGICERCLEAMERTARNRVADAHRCH